MSQPDYPETVYSPSGDNMSYLKNYRTISGKRRMTKLYTTWTRMRYRCTNGNYKGYKRYGGRGISICDEWQLFDNFRNWAIRNGVCRGLTIDRINNDGNYKPNNCRWTTQAVQSENSSHPIIIEFNGERLNQSQWARRLGITQGAMRHRLKTWILEDALTMPRFSRCKRESA